MSLKSWFSSKSNNPNQPAVAVRRAAMFTVEQLEGRTLLSVAPAPIADDSRAALATIAPALTAQTQVAAPTLSPSTLVATSLSTPAVATSFVGNTLTFSSTLSSSAAPGGVGIGSVVSFTLTDSTGNAVNTASGTTDASGTATASFPAVTRGSFTVAVSFAGNGTLDASSATSAAFSVYQKVALSTSASPGVAGVPTTLSATLLTSPGSTPLSGQVIAFSTSGGSPPSGSSTTGANGTASVSITYSSYGSFSYTATFQNTANYFADVNGNPIASTVQGTVTLVPATSSLTAPAVTTVLVGNSFNVSSTLSRVTSPNAGPFAGSVLFTLTDAKGHGVASNVVTAGFNGIATASLVAPARGVYTVVASFAGDTAQAATSATSAPMTVYQAATLALPPQTVSGVAGAPVQFTAVLTAVPQGTPIAGQIVVFSFGSSAAATATTDASGIATVTKTFATAGSSGYNVAFAAPANGYTDSAGTLPPVALQASGNYQITTAASALSVSAPATLVAGTALTVSATLTRVTAPAGILAGTSVQFTVAQPSGITTIANATTDANGVATITFDASLTNVAGRYTVSAAFAGDAGTTASNSPTTTTNVLIATSLSSISAPATAFAGDTVQLDTILSQHQVNVPASQTVVSASVTFTITNPDSTSSVVIVTTDGSGHANASFTPNAGGGIYQIQASYAGNSTLAPSTSSVSTIAITQKSNFSLVSPVISAVAGAQTTLSAVLTATSQNKGIAGVTITFNVAGQTLTAVTVGDGTASVTTTFASSGNFPLTATRPQTDFLTDAAANSSPVTVLGQVNVSTAPTTLTPVTVPSIAYIGDVVSFSSQLQRLDSSGVNGASVVFTITDPNAQISTVTAPTGADGTASGSFSATAKGIYTIQASFAGSSALSPSSSTTAQSEVYQKTQLTLAPINAVAGAPTTLSATLLAIPAGTPLAGLTVYFDFGGVIPSVEVNTNSSGVATISPTFTASGPVTVTATALITSSSDYADHTGATNTPDSTQSTFTVAPALTSLALSAPASAEVGDQLTLSAQLTRTTAPAGAVTGSTVSFTVTDPSGGFVVFSATTDSIGIATVTTNALISRGAYSVTASFAGNSSLAPSSKTASVPTYQRTQLTLAQVANVKTGVFTPFSATLVTPAGVPLGSQTVTFDFGGAIPSLTSTTNAAGIATVFAKFPNAGPVTATASFQNVADYLTNRTGALAAESAFVTFPVAPSQVATSVNVNWTDGTSAVFNGNPHTASAFWTSLGTDGGTGPLTVSYFATGDLLHPLSVVPTIVGSYVATASYGGDATHFASNGSANFSITQATPLVAINAASISYNGNPSTVSASITGVSAVPGNALENVPVTLKYYAGSTATGSPLSAVPTTVGTYTVVAGFVGSTDYIAASKSATFTITPATPAVTLSAPGAVYTGTPYAAMGTVAGASSLEGVGLTFVYYAGTSVSNTPLASAPTNAGTYTVVAKFAGSTDYTSAQSLPATFNIAPVSTGVTVSSNAASGATLGQVITFTATVSTPTAVTGATPGAVQFFIDGSAYQGPVSLVNGVATITNAALQLGNHTVTATYVSGSTNFAGSTTTTVFTQPIVKFTPVIANLSAPTIPYNTVLVTLSGTLANPSTTTIKPTGTVIVSATFGGKVVATQTVSVSSAGAFSATFLSIFAGVGQYTLTYAYSGDAKYAASTGTTLGAVTWGVSAVTPAKVKAGSTVTLKLSLADVFGLNFSSSGTAVTATGIASATTPNTITALPAGNTPTFAYSLGAYTLNLKTTTSMAAGTYLLYFNVAGDPILHSIQFLLS